MKNQQGIPTWLKVTLVVAGVLFLLIFGDRIDWPKVWPYVVIFLGAAFVYGVWQLFMVHVPAIAKASKETAEHLRAIRERLEGPTPEPPGPGASIATTRRPETTPPHPPLELDLDGPKTPG